MDAEIIDIPTTQPVLISKIQQSSMGEKTMGVIPGFWGGLTGLVQALNPLGPLVEAYTATLHYRHQVKLLQVEQERIIKEAEIRHNQIDAALQIAIKILDDRRNAMEQSIKIAIQELQQSHIERIKIIECIKNLNNGILNRSYSLEERQLMRLSLADMGNLLSNLGKQSTTNLSLIAQNTQKALDAVPSARGLLTFSSE